MQDALNLKGKTINIREAAYIVDKVIFDEETNEDVIVLKHKRKKAQNYPTTVFDLGYSSPDQLKYAYGDEEINAVLSMIDSNRGHTIEIAMIDPSGLIKNKDVTLMGLSVQDKSLYTIQPAESGSSEVAISLELLVQSILLNGELKTAQHTYKGEIPSARDVYDETIRNAAKSKNSKRPKSSNSDRLDEALKKIASRMDRDDSKQDSSFDMNNIENLMSSMLGGKMPQSGEFPKEFDKVFAELGKAFSK